MCVCVGRVYGYIYGIYGMGRGLSLGNNTDKISVEASLSAPFGHLSDHISRHEGVWPPDLPLSRRVFDADGTTLGCWTCVEFDTMMLLLWVPGCVSCLTPMVLLWFCWMYVGFDC